MLKLYRLIIEGSGITLTVAFRVTPFLNFAQNLLISCLRVVNVTLDFFFSQFSAHAPNKPVGVFYCLLLKTKNKKSPVKFFVSLFGPCFPSFLENESKTANSLLLNAKCC